MPQHSSLLPQTCRLWIRYRIPNIIKSFLVKVLLVQVHYLPQVNDLLQQDPNFTSGSGGYFARRVFCRALQAEQNPHLGEQNAHRGERGTVRGGYIGLKGCREALRGEC